MNKCVPAVRNNSTDIDTWEYNFSMFKNSHKNFGEALCRKAFFERVTYEAGEFMIPYRNDLRYSVDDLIYHMRIRYCLPRRFPIVMGEIRAFARIPGELIANFMTRYEKLYTELILLGKSDHYLKQEAVWLYFQSFCTDARCREKLDEAGLTESQHLNLGIAVAQTYYNDYDLKPWSARHVQEEVKRNKQRDTQESRQQQGQQQSPRGRG